MENPSPQPQYFRFNEDPQQAPKQSPWRPEVIKRIALIGAVILVLILAGVFITNLVKGLSSSDAQKELEATQAEVAQRQEDCNEDDETCKNQAQTQVARAAGIAEACEGLEDKALKNCVTLIAQKEKDADACDALEG